METTASHVEDKHLEDKDKKDQKKWYQKASSWLFIGLGIFVIIIILTWSRHGSAPNPQPVTRVDSVKQLPAPIVAPTTTPTPAPVQPGAGTGNHGGAFTATTITFAKSTQYHVVNINDSVSEVHSDDGSWERMKAPIRGVNNADGSITLNGAN